MEKVLPLRPVKGAVQREAMIPGLAVSFFHIDMLYNHPANGIFSKVQVAHHTAVSADGDGKLLTGRQTIIHPLCKIFAHYIKTLSDFYSCFKTKIIILDRYSSFVILTTFHIDNRLNSYSSELLPDYFIDPLLNKE
jgi:hypothetical protein